MTHAFSTVDIPQLTPFATNGVYDAPMFTERSEAVEYFEKNGCASLYAWQSGEGGYNKLVNSWSIVDVIGYVILPVDLGTEYDLPDDSVENSMKNETFANVSWSAADLMDNYPNQFPDEESANEWLEEHEDDIIDVMIGRGWDYIHSMVDED